MCLCTLKGEAAMAPPKSRSKRSAKETAVAKEREKKSREGQRNKKRALLRASSTSDCTEPAQDQQQTTLELLRSQRQGKHTQTHSVRPHHRFYLVVVTLLSVCMCVCLCMFSCAAWKHFAGSCQPMERWFWRSGSTQSPLENLKRPSTLSSWEPRDGASCSAEEPAPTPPSAKITCQSALSANITHNCEWW